MELIAFGIWLIGALVVGFCLARHQYKQAKKKGLTEPEWVGVEPLAALAWPVIPFCFGFVILAFAIAEGIAWLAKKTI